MSELKQFTYEEVKKTNANNRTVLAIHDKVYEVTKFLNDHPGGEEILLDHGGKDATDYFNDVGHSADAQELMKKYVIGEIVEAERRNLPKKTFEFKGGDQSAENNAQGSGTPFLALAGAAAIVAVIFFYYFL